MAADDADALARARDGDRRAFGTLVRKYQRRVYATAYHVTGNHSDADDVVQETFVRAYRKLASFDGRAEFFTWLYRVAVNTSLNHLRRRRRVHLGEGEDAAARDNRASPGHDPREWAELGQRMRAVLAAMAELSAKLRVTLVLATIEGLPYREISQVLEIPEGTVAWRVSEARKQLRARLDVDRAPAGRGRDPK